MNTMLANYINGNLATARHQARRYGFARIVSALRDMSYSANRAALTAAYLKGNRDAWQAACDAE